MILDCGGKPLDLTTPVVMGILNVTPDSFSDGGRFDSTGLALEHAGQMIADGAAIIDVGGESTRPGAAPVSAQHEIDRVVPVIASLVELGAIVSVDSSKPEVMRAAADAGAGLLNDVRALREPGALDAAAASGLPVCLMHMQGEPRTMQHSPRYDDVVYDIGEFMTDRIEACEAVGIGSDRLILDPGIGFGKTLTHNLEILANLDQLVEAFELPILVGVSRKSMLGQILDVPLDQRLAGGLAAALLAVRQGASIVRTHDVRPTVEALTVTREVADHRR